MLLARDAITIESTYEQINRRLEQSIPISFVCSVATRLIRNSKTFILLQRQFIQHKDTRNNA